jgi:putative ABC transport system permease protein
VSLTSWGLEERKPGRVRLTSALALYRVRLRARWMQELLAVIGIAAGVALLYATQVASTSLSGPVRQMTAGIVGSSQLQMVARGATVFPERTYNTVVAVPGVRRAAPILQAAGNVVGPRGERGVTFFGADPRIVHLRGQLLQGFSAADAARQETLVLPSPMARAIGVRVGDDVRLQLAGRSTTIPAVVAGSDQMGSLVDTSIALVPLAYLQRLAGVGQGVSRILVEAEPGQVDAVRRRLQPLAGETDIRPADDEARLFDQAAKPWRQSSAIFSVLSALVGWLFAVCALLVTAADRRKLAVQQHNQGLRPSTTLKTLLVDAGVIGLIGVGVGLLAGELLSRRGFQADISFLSGAFPIGDRRVVTWQSIAVASGGGLLAAAIGVLAPVRDVVAASISGRARGPGADLRAPRPDRARMGALPVLGSMSLAAAIALTVAAPGAAALSLVLLGLALVFLLPAILSRTIALLAWTNRQAGYVASVELALQQLCAARWRTRALAITATGAIAAFGGTSLQGARANLQGGLDRVTHGLDDVSPLWISPTGAGSVFGTSSFAPTDPQRLAQLPGIRDVSLYRAGLLDVAGSRAWVIGQPPGTRQAIPPGEILDGELQGATAHVRAGGWVTVSRSIAERLHLHVGQRFTLPTPKPLPTRLAAITTNFGWSGGSIVINATDFARGWGSDAAAAYHLQLAPGATPEQARRRVARALGPRSALHVETAAQRRDTQTAASRSGLARLRQIAGLTLLAAVLAMGAAMTGLLWQHRAVIASLKLNGLRTSLMWRSLVVETAVLFCTGAIAGGLLGLLGQVLCTRGVLAVTGFPVLDALRLDIAATTVGVVLGASLLVVLIPGYLVARVKPSWKSF